LEALEQGAGQGLAEIALALRGFLPVARRSPTNYVLVIGLVVAPVVALVGLWDDPGGVPRPTPTWRKRGKRVTDLSLGQQIAASRGHGRGRMRGCRPVSGRGR
jgi:hypothetical protein